MSKIYKYFSCNEKHIESFRENYLWFSKPKFLNDPFDCNISHYSQVLKDMKQQDKFPCRSAPYFPPDFTDEVLYRLIDSVNDYGVCCFSKEPDNELLWSHYAKSHSGICIEYEAEELNDLAGRMRSELTNVDYEDTLIDLTQDIEWKQTNNGCIYSPIRTILRDDRNFDKLWLKLLTRKKTIWETEEEKRFIIMTGGVTLIEKGVVKGTIYDAGYKIPIKREMITGIILGAKSDEITNEIKSIFGNSVIYKKAKLDGKFN